MGQRVVVRYLLPDGSATDVLGVCTTWGEAICAIETDRGAVALRIDRIVTGKPVPPRASVRHRVSVREAELHTKSWYGGAEVEELGEWRLRFEPEHERIRSRFNSCLALGDPGVPDALDRVQAFYAERDRQPLLHVELGTAIEGWEPVPGKDAHFQLTSIAQVKRRLRLPEVNVMLGNSPGSPVASAWIGANEVADCEALLDGDWLGLDGLRVKPEFRRRGLARAVIGVLLEWGAERGATTVWLHVETDNEPALALYQSLGFRTHHTMGYLRPRRE